MGTSKTRTEKLTLILEDLDSISNGHLEAIVVKKEKVKFQVLQNSSDEESTPKANGKKEDHSDSEDSDDLASSEDEKDSDFDSDVIEQEQVQKRKIKKVSLILSQSTGSSIVLWYILEGQIAIKYECWI